MTTSGFVVMWTSTQVALVIFELRTAEAHS